MLHFNDLILFCNQITNAVPNCKYTVSQKSDHQLMVLTLVVHFFGTHCIHSALFVLMLFVCQLNCRNTHCLVKISVELDCCVIKGMGTKKIFKEFLRT